MTVFGGICATILLAGCGATVQPTRPLPVAPYAYLSLNACKAYGSNIVECQLDYLGNFGRQRLGPVQQKSRPAGRGNEDYQYQVSTCMPMQRVQKELPIYLCEIYGARSGADAGSVYIKGGTAVRLARVLGDPEQLRYRWQPDVWSRVRG
ncbi:hypothetical protein CEJ86_24900 [Sinorhizobium meliloti]|uniref:Uncharacterized protein n=1 Tax=Rhizobium meliloti TaxID=382 RepID=A0A2J0YX12_RHIML|nr:hypothetical protein CEJ86_24900 [Sinorhizobium meliloti]